MNQQDIFITTERQARLAATLFTPDTPTQSAIMLAPATGIKRQFYQNFAQFLAQHGHGVITFDNEGIGGSLTGQLTQCDASLITWGQADMSAVLNELMSRFPHARYHLLGHSAGGQLFGLMPNHHHLSSVFNVGCSSGCIRNMKLPYRLKAQYFMNIFIPLNAMLFGHVKTASIGMGEHLPKNVALQWRQWCNGQGYIETAFGKTVHSHYYHDIALPALWLHASDDDIANTDNVADMIRVFPKMQATHQTLHPQDHGLTQIGHMKFFSRQSRTLWPLALNWFAQHHQSTTNH